MKGLGDQREKIERNIEVVSIYENIESEYKARD